MSDLNTNKFCNKTGHFAYASFIICAISGVILAIPYDVSDAFNSLSLHLLKNPYAVFFRTVHYWSAQLTLILTALHICDHIRRGNQVKLSRGKWLRLLFAILFLFYVMLSGFILKGDAESIQARNVFEGLLASVPFIGEYLKYLLIGPEGNMQLLYINHAATATIIIWITTIEHSRQLQPNVRYYVYSLASVIALSIFLVPALHDPLDPVVKSPWYFLGFQEILHWLSTPEISLFILLIIVMSYYLLYYRDKPFDKYNKRLLLLILLLYAGTGIFAYFFRIEGWRFGTPAESQYDFNSGFRSPFSIIASADDDALMKDVSFVRGRAEGCMSCHDNTNGFVASHDPEALGCNSCHLGDIFTLNKDLAHSGMLMVPGNLDMAERTCGGSECHEGIPSRVSMNLMTTMAGIVAVDKYVFGEADSLNGYYHIDRIGHSNADLHLRNLCASCHLSQRKDLPAPVDELSRGGGCVACHVVYSPEAANELENRYNDKIFYENYPKFHPKLTVESGNEHCFGCHSRSGRLTLNYDGWVETELKLDDIEKGDTNRYRLLMDGRIFAKMPADIHSEAGMLCIDCHGSYEVMGDGKKYFHKEQQVKVQCEDCHFTDLHQTAVFDSLDLESRKIIQLRNLNRPGREFLIMRKTGRPVVNSYLDSAGNPVMRLKNGSKVMALKQPLQVCGSDIPGHKSLTCESCHNRRTTQCTGCHTYFSPEEEGWDHLLQEEVKGTWEEKFKEIFPAEPTLGVRMTEEGKEIINFMIGMVMTLDIPDQEKMRFQRLYSPAFSHTIRREARSCRSCHNQPSALGYGEGSLIYTVNGKKGKWEFRPKYPASEYDGLPEDAWTGFLQGRTGIAATRHNTRPFTVEEQKNILLAGACLECHSESEPKVMHAFTDFKNFRKYLSQKCVLPEW